MAHRCKEIEKAKIEIIKIFTSIWDQEMKIKAKQLLRSDMTTKTINWDDQGFSSVMRNMKDSFPMLLKTLREK